MNPQNRSQATSFELKSKHLGKLWSHAQFQANINTQAHYDMPYYSLPVICAVGNGDIIYLGLKTECSIAILQVSNKIELKYSMDFGDAFIRKHKKISTFEFVYNPIKNNSEQLMLVGFQDGFILMVEIFSTKFINHYNCFQDAEKIEIFRKANVNRICMVPFKEQFLACLADSSIIKYSIQSQKSNGAFLSTIMKKEEKLAFDKNFEKYPQKRKKLDEFCEFGVIHQEEFCCYALYSTEEYRDPIAYFKFKCMTISDVVVLTPEHYAYSLTSGLENKYEPFIIAYTGYDGYMRIVDMHNLQPLYLFKSNYGGINSIVFENATSPIVAMGCQDDSTIVLNMQNNKYVRITGQQSFISRAVFQEIDPKILRVLSGSYDGSISIIEFPKKLLTKTHYQTPSKYVQQPGVGQEHLPEYREAKQEQKNGNNIKNKSQENIDLQEEQKTQQINQQQQEQGQESEKQNYNSQDSQNGSINPEMLPITVIYDKTTCIEMELNQETDDVVKVNYEGIGYVESYKRFLFTSAFDGCCTGWIFLDQDGDQEKDQLQQQNKRPQKRNRNKSGEFKQKQLQQYSQNENSLEN